MENITRSKSEKLQMAIVVLIIAAILLGSLYFSGIM
jgi:hypothetical protein